MKKTYEGDKLISVELDEYEQYLLARENNRRLREGKEQSDDILHRRDRDNL